VYFMTDRLRHVTCRNTKKIFSQKTGEHVDTVRRLSAEFERGIPAWALPTALEKFPKAPEMKPDGMPLERWLCWYDSRFDQALKNLTDEEREIIERKLNGRPGIVMVEEPKVPAPWPAYDKIKEHGQKRIEHVVAEIVDTVDKLELNPEGVIAYERQNRNRAEVIAALEALMEKDEDEPLIEA